MPLAKDVPAKGARSRLSAFDGYKISSVRSAGERSEGHGVDGFEGHLLRPGAGDSRVREGDREGGWHADATSILYGKGKIYVMYRARNKTVNENFI